MKRFGPHNPEGNNYWGNKSTMRTDTTDTSGLIQDTSGSLVAPSWVAHPSDSSRVHSVQGGKYELFNLHPDDGTLIIMGHPGHEMRAHGMISACKPHYIIVTEGGGALETEDLIQAWRSSTSLAQ